MAVKRHFRKYHRWLAHRRHYLGASESPILSGYGYSGSSQMGLYAAKVGGEEPDDFPEPLLKKLRLGLAVEKGLMELLSEELGVKIRPQGRTTYLHDERTFIGATPDGLAEGDGGGEIPVEVKNVGKWQTSDWDNGQTPLRFLMQVQHQIYVMGAGYGYIAANLANEEMVHRRIPRDDELIELMVLQMEKFWNLHILLKNPPDPDETIECKEAIHRLYPQSEPTLAVHLPEPAIGLLEQREAHKKEEQAAKAKQEKINNTIKMAMGEAQYALLPDAQVIKWATQGGNDKTCPKCHEVIGQTAVTRPMRVLTTMPTERLNYVEPNPTPGLTYVPERSNGAGSGEPE